MGAIAGSVAGVLVVGAIVISVLSKTGHLKTCRRGGPPPTDTTTTVETPASGAVPAAAQFPVPAGAQYPVPTATQYPVASGGRS